MLALNNWNQFDWDRLEEQETPAFIYDLDHLGLTAEKLKSELGQFADSVRLYYSLKSNPQEDVVRFLGQRLDGFDVSSEQELKFLRRLRIDGSRLSVSGPGKTDSTIKLSVEMGVNVLQLDSYDEWLAATQFGVPSMSLRISDQGVFSKKLGLSDYEFQQVLKSFRGTFVGLHSYLGRESFSWELLQQSADRMSVRIGQHASSFVQTPTFFIGPGIFGSGISSSYTGSRIKNPVVFEIGRGLVSSCGYYLSKVLARKKMDRGGEALIIHGGLQHLGSPLTNLKSAQTDMVVDSFHNHQLNLKEKKEFIIYGSLCLGQDILHPRAQVASDVQAGDWLLFPNTGAYGLTAGVPSFIGQDLPKEYIFQNQKFIDKTMDSFKLYHEGFTQEIR